MNVFLKLWNQFTQLAPSAEKIHQLFAAKGDIVENDHIAFRTFNDPRINIEVVSTPFLLMGYKPVGEYHFTEKKLNARHYEHTDSALPKIFISELMVDKLSESASLLIKEFLQQLDSQVIDPNSLLYSGRLWETPSYETYNTLSKESEYAAWVYVNGFCVNHFTVFTNSLNHFDSLSSVNLFLKENGFKLNSSGGEIKGSPAELLEQSSILADHVNVQFKEGSFVIPGCYYEFARRYPAPNGQLYQGFIAASANKIFESTDTSLSRQQ